MYLKLFIIQMKKESAARELRTSPCYDRMKNLGAVFGQKFGWERPNFFAVLMEWNKKMIGLLEDQNGLKL